VDMGPRAGYDKFTGRAIMTLIGGWCISIAIGEQIAWGNQSTYVASYFKMLGHDVDME
jgi:hypothetical protein